MDMQQAGPKCNCTHHKMKPILMVLFGLVFLLGTLDVLTSRTVSIVWPIIVILAGLMKLMGGRCGCCSRA
jgi:Domain of unknown function (DUF5668)